LRKASPGQQNAHFAARGQRGTQLACQCFAGPATRTSMPKVERTTVRFLGLATVAGMLVTGCANAFGLGGYSFDDGAPADENKQAPTVTSLVDATDGGVARVAVPAPSKDASHDVTADASPDAHSADAAGSPDSSPPPDADSGPVPTSSDGKQNGSETDVDCGGGAAPMCSDTKRCVDGVRDCTSSVCTNQTCRAATLTDGYKNGTETDVDCGGGNGAPACANGRQCAVAGRDCFSLVCAGTCIAPSFADGVTNGSETDVDCGGPEFGAPMCADGKACVESTRDCASGICLAGVCQAPANDDGVRNGTETDVDCGGGNGAPLCADGMACVDSARDCSSPNCLGNLCTP